MKKKTGPKCSRCPTTACNPAIGSHERSPEKPPAFCPMNTYPEVMQMALEEYAKPEVKEFARQASIQESECYENTPQGRRNQNTPGLWN